jgi:hypothetical protein
MAIIIMDGTTPGTITPDIIILIIMAIMGIMMVITRPIPGLVIIM